MSARTYFRLSLLLPLLLPVALLPFTDLSGIVAILWMSLGFGGPAYILYGVIIFLWLGKISTSWGMRKLTYWAPIIFIPIQSVSWLIHFHLQKQSNPELTGGIEGIPVFAVYILLLGYIYVGIVNAGYYILECTGGVREP